MPPLSLAETMLPHTPVEAASSRFLLSPKVGSKEERGRMPRLRAAIPETVNWPSSSVILMERP
jgi:hypothetical protein